MIYNMLVVVCICFYNYLFCVLNIIFRCFVLKASPATNLWSVRRRCFGLQNYTFNLIQPHYFCCVPCFFKVLFF